MKNAKGTLTKPGMQNHEGSARCGIHTADKGDGDVAVVLPQRAAKARSYLEWNLSNVEVEPRADSVRGGVVADGDVARHREHVGEVEDGAEVQRGIVV